MGRMATGLLALVVTMLFTGNLAQARQNPAGNAESPAESNDRGTAFCGSHQTGRELQWLMMTGQIGREFIAGDLEEVNGSRLAVKLLKGDVVQPVEVGKRTIVCLQDKDGALRSIAVGDIKVGTHVFGAGKLDHGVFVVKKALYVMVFKDQAAQQ